MREEKFMAAFPKEEMLTLLKEHGGYDS